MLVSGRVPHLPFHQPSDGVHHSHQAIHGALLLMADEKSRRQPTATSGSGPA